MAKSFVTVAPQRFPSTRRRPQLCQFPAGGEQVRLLAVCLALQISLLRLDMVKGSLPTFIPDFVSDNNSAGASGEGGG